MIRSSWVDHVQTGLDVAGLVPGVGEIADGINAGIYYARGDYLNAGLSAAAMIPFAGWAATGTKMGIKGVKAAAKGGTKLLNQFNSVESLISSSTFKQLGRSNKVLQTTIKGNGNNIFKTLSHGGQRLPSGAMKLSNGTTLFKHISKTTGEFTLDINKAGQLYKIRINP